MDMKTLGASSTTAAGQGRRTFRGSRWRATNDASVAATAGVLAANVNYVVQLKAQDIANTPAVANDKQSVGCGVFRPYNEESFKKVIEDIFIPLAGTSGAAAVYTAADGNAGGVLSDMQDNQSVVRDATSNVIGQAAMTPGVTTKDMATTTPVDVTPAPAITAPATIV